MRDWLLYIKDLFHDTVWVWLTDVVFWRIGQQRRQKFFARYGIYFDKKGNIER